MSPLVLRSRFDHFKVYMVNSYFLVTCNPLFTIVFGIIFQLVLKIGVFTDVIYAAEPSGDTNKNEDSIAYTIWTKVYHVLTLGGANPDFKEETESNQPEKAPVRGLVDNGQDSDQDSDQDTDEGELDYKPSGNITINFMMNIWDWCTGNGPYKYVNQNNDEDVPVAPIPEFPIPAPIPEVPVPVLVPENPIPIPEVVPPIPVLQIINLSEVLIDPHFKGVSGFTKAVIRNYLDFKQLITETPNVTSPNSPAYAALFTNVLDHIDQPQPSTKIVDEISADLYTIIVLTDNPDAKALTQAFIHAVIAINADVLEYQDEFGVNDPVKLTETYLRSFYKAQQKIEESISIVTGLQ